MTSQPRFAIVRDDEGGRLYVTPPGAVNPFFDTRWPAERTALELRNQEPSVTFTVVEVPADDDDGAAE
jgi:hypothetical protein